MPDHRYHYQLLDAGPLLLDGGGMFGLIPRVVWSRTIDTDSKNRIALRHNCLLLTGVDDDPALGRPRRVVIETGTGDKLDDKMASIFGLGEQTIESAVRDAGVDPDEIDDVIVSHLHFDHAGGLTRRPRDNERPDWIPQDVQSDVDARGVRLTFPNAVVHAQHNEWTDALDNNSVMTRTYFRDHLEPIAPRLNLVESPPPFEPAHKPDREESPPTRLDERLSEVAPGVRVFQTPGHTWGQQAVLFEDPKGHPIVFVPDVMPTAWHVGQAYSLAYDVEPYVSMVTKRWFLWEAVERGWTLVLDHDPNTPIVRARAKDAWFALDSAVP